MSRIKLLQSGMQVCQRFHKAGVISGLPELFLQPSDFLSQGSIFRTQILALLTQKLLLRVDSLCSGGDFFRLCQDVWQVCQRLGVLSLLLFQPTLQYIQIISCFIDGCGQRRLKGKL